MSLIKDQSNLIKSLQKIIEGLNTKLEKFENAILSTVWKTKVIAFKLV